MVCVENWKRLSLVAAGAVLMSIGMGNAAQAMTFTNPATGNEYFLTEAPSSWTQAQARAKSAAGNLVTINNVQEQKWLLDVFGSTEMFWIGFTDQETEGVWKWASGEAVTYTNWTSTDPNDAQFFGNQFLGGEDYAVMGWQQNGKWNDLPNNVFPARGIVEIIKAAIPDIPFISDREDSLACQ